MSFRVARSRLSRYPTTTIMPRLHKYRERNACYVLTAIRGNVINYQLTPDGERKFRK